MRLLLQHLAPRLCAALLWLTCWEHALAMQICQLTRAQQNRSSSEDRGVDTRDRSARGVSSKCAISRSWLNFTNTSPCSFAMLARLPPRYGWCSLAKADTGAWDKTGVFVVSSSSSAHHFSVQVSFTRYSPKMFSALNASTGTRKSGASPTPGKHQRSRCRAPHTLTYGCLRCASASSS